MTTSDIPPLNVKINIDASGVQAGVAKATAGLEQVSERSKRMSTSMSNLKSTMLGVFGGTLLTSSLFALGRELSAMKQEAIDLQVSTERLNQALSGVGITSKQTQEDVLNVADAYYQLGFEGSETINAMGTLVTATGSVAQSTKLMAMAADLARYKHIDMNTAATILARGTQGSAKAFKELGITLDTSLPKNKAISKAFDELNTKIGGQATAYTKTFAGQIDILKERFDNIAQAIGAVVLPVLTRLVTALSGAFNWIAQNSTALKIYLGIIGTIIIAVKGWAMAQAALAAVMAINPLTLWIAGIAALGVAFVAAWNHFEGFRKAVATGISAILKFVGYLIGGVATLLRAMSNLPKMGFLKGVADDADKAAKAMGNFAKSVEKTSDKKITAPKIPKIAGTVKPGDPTGITGLVPGGDIAGGGGGGAQTVQYITVYASNTNDIEKKLAMAAKVGVPVGSK
jgi:hypothetical protein